MAESIKMNKTLVRPGTRFRMNDEYGGIKYYFGYERGKDLVIRRKGGHYIGDVTNFNEAGFQVTTWIMKQPASVWIPYSDVEYVTPKNDFD